MSCHLIGTDDLTDCLSHQQLTACGPPIAVLISMHTDRNWKVATDRSVLPVSVGDANWKVGLGLPHLIASHRISSHLIASHRISSHLIASHRISSHLIASPQVGLGLPLARLYAKYFGGTLHLAPMEGYGTDGYI